MQLLRIRRFPFKTLPRRPTRSGSILVVLYSAGDPIRKSTWREIMAKKVVYNFWGRGARS